MVDLLGFEDVTNTDNSPKEVETFSKNFWGEKGQGFSVLCNNLKHSQNSIKALQECIKDRANTENDFAKNLTKLAKSSTPTHNSTLGSFSPMFDILRSMSEKMSSCHMDTVTKLTEINKELGKYQEEYKAKTKSMKETISSTQDAIHQVHVATTAVTKSKEKYHNQCHLVEKMKNDEGFSSKEIEKVESKIKKLEDDYRANIEKHKKHRINYDSKMNHGCDKFQEVEEFHLEKMKKILDKYVLSFENASILISQVHREIRSKVEENSTRELINKHCKSKGTGVKRPPPLLFENYKPKIAPPNGGGNSASSALASNILVSIETPSAASPTTQQQVSNGHQSQGGSNKTGFIRDIRRKVKREKGNKGRGSTSSKTSNDKDTVSGGSPEKDAQSLNVDEEGYTIRPENTKSNQGKATPSEKSWKYESSDDSSDSDDDVSRKIHVKIRPKDEAKTDDKSNLDALNSLKNKLTLLPAPNPSNTKKSPSSGAIKQLSSRKQSTDSTPQHLTDFFSGSSTATTSPSPSNQNPTLSTSTGNFPQQEDLFAAAPPPIKPAGDMLRASMKSAPPTTNNMLAMLQDERKSSISSINFFPSLPTVPGTTTSSRPRNRSSLRGSAEKNGLAKENNKNVSSDEISSNSKQAPLASSESWDSISSMRSATPSFDFATARGSNTPSHQDRGGSPLTIYGHGDQVPFAVSFKEVVDANIQPDAPDGGKYVAKVRGEVHLSFYKGVVKTFLSNQNAPSVLTFEMTQVPVAMEIVPNKYLLKMDSRNGGKAAFSFNMPELLKYFSKVSSDKKNSYIVFTAIKYMYNPDTSKCKDVLPVDFSCSWSNNGTNSNHVKLQYSYNKEICAKPIGSLEFILPVDKKVQNVETSPVPAVWKPIEKRLCWKTGGAFAPPSGKSLVIEGEVVTCDVCESPSSGKQIAAIFTSQSCVLTGVNFQVNCGGYRATIVKKSFKSGKYFSTITT